MLLRSASSPILNSWMNPTASPDHNIANIAAAADFVSQRPARSVTGTMSHHLSFTTAHAKNSSPTTSSSRILIPAARLSRAMSESDLSGSADPLPPPLPSSSNQMINKRGRRIQLTNSFTSLEEEEEEEQNILLPDKRESSNFSSPGPGGNDDELCADEGLSGSICGGGGRRGKRPGSAHHHHHHHHHDNKEEDDEDMMMDTYYHKMIQANPNNPLLLGNYAKFLKEVRGDVAKAEDYCARAILANSNKINNPSTDKDGDGDAGWVLALYADLIWQRTKDAQRAHTYFNRAVQAAPDDCYVMASYARFLWDADEEDDDEQEKEKEKENNQNQAWPPPFLFPQLAAAS